MSPQAHIRDAALRRLRSANRWLIAGSVALTGVFAELAANAFPGHSQAKASTSARAGAAGRSTGTTTTSRSTPLRPPTQAPQGTTATEASEGTSTPETHESAPAATPEPTHEETPVVSGGS